MTDLNTPIPEVTDTWRRRLLAAAAVGGFILLAFAAGSGNSSPASNIDEERFTGTVISDLDASIARGVWDAFDDEDREAFCEWASTRSDGEVFSHFLQTSEPGVAAAIVLEVRGNC